MEIVIQGAGQGSGPEIAGICPHCKRDVVFMSVITGIPDLHLTPDYWLGHRRCPNRGCNKHVFFIAVGTSLAQVYPPVPIQQGRPPLPQSVPQEYRDEFAEAAAVIDLSPKSSSALSRRCLQRLLREHLNIKKRDLSQEIDELLATGGLPSHLAASVDAIRNIGNFAAHPLKNTNTGEIVDVEPGEAEWLLDVLEMLFDFYFVHPMGAQARKDALNQKLLSLGKPPMK
jgi:hypothetical protein